MDDGLLIGDRVVDELVREIGRYLALVTLLRQEGYEPHWASDPAAQAGGPRDGISRVHVTRHPD